MFVYILSCLSNPEYKVFIQDGKRGIPIDAQKEAERKSVRRRKKREDGRLGVSEMTRFGMEEDDFAELAGMIRSVVLDGKNLKEEVKAFRKRFLDIRYCFTGADFAPLEEKLHSLL